LNGNRTAEEKLYNKYKKIIKDFILSKYSIYYDIDDDVSEILIKVFLNLKNYNVLKSKFKTWVIIITKNYLIDKWRCKTIEISNNFTNIPTNGDIVFDSDYNSICNFEYNSTITYLSAQLSPSDYTLLNMKYIQGYNYDEIGREFQITSSTVSNKINYIKTKLKRNTFENIYD
jgi:RNA polymerase sigma factor (sigma-70 family)